MTLHRFALVGLFFLFVIVNPHHGYAQQEGYQLKQDLSQARVALWLDHNYVKNLTTLSSDSPLKGYTLVSCMLEKESDSLTLPTPNCAPLFWGTNDQPLILYLDQDGRFDPSDINQEINRAYKYFQDDRHFYYKSIGTLLGVTGISWASYAYFAHPAVGLAVSLALTAITGGYGSQYFFIKPTMEGGFMGKTTGTMPSLDYHGELLARLDYYEPTEADLFLINHWQKLMDVRAANDLESQDKLRDNPYPVLLVNNIADQVLMNLAHIFYYHKLADDSSLSQLCLPTGDDELRCHSVERTLRYVRLSQESEVRKSWRNKLTQLSVDTDTGQDAKVASAVTTDRQEGDDLVTMPPLFSPFSSDDLTTIKSPPAILNGFDYQSAARRLDDHDVQMDCPSAEELSPYAADRDLYVIEAYYNCTYSGGGQSCATKYQCTMPVFSQETCVTILESLNAVKEALGAPLIPVDVRVRDYCEVSSGEL
ncbi:MAG: hypothetical protein OXC40_03125 [Proteobacteria bacterium]|nr:hypothetical protein [Pseudomonadota bacterium]